MCHIGLELFFPSVYIIISIWCQIIFNNVLKQIVFFLFYLFNSTFLLYIHIYFTLKPLRLYILFKYTKKNWVYVLYIIYTRTLNKTTKCSTKQAREDFWKKITLMALLLTKNQPTGHMRTKERWRKNKKAIKLDKIKTNEWRVDLKFEENIIYKKRRK